MKRPLLAATAPAHAARVLRCTSIDGKELGITAAMPSATPHL